MQTSGPPPSTRPPATPRSSTTWCSRCSRRVAASRATTTTRPNRATLDLVGKLAGHHEHVDQCAVAPHRHLDPACDRILDHQLLNRGCGDDAMAVDADHDVAAPHAGFGGGAARDHAGDLQAV